MQIRYLMLAVFLIGTNNFSFSQVTLGKIEKVKVAETLVFRPEPYDSSYNIGFKDIKHYIGLEFYLTPKKYYGSGDCRNQAFIFSSKPNIFKIDTSKKELKLVDKWRYYYNGYHDRSNEFKDIITCVYKPYHQSSGSRGLELNLFNNYDSVCNQYYILIDVLTGEAKYNWYKKYYLGFDSVAKIYNEPYELYKKGKNDAKVFNAEHYYNYGLKVNCRDYSTYFTNSSQLTDIEIYVFRVKGSKDTVFFTNIDNLILVPYFMKQKKLYESKPMVCIGGFEKKDIKTDKLITIPIDYSKPKRITKWFCKEVTLLKNADIYPEKNYDHSCDIFYILTNDNGETIALSKFQNNNNDFEFVLEKEYISRQQEVAKQQQLQKLNREQQIAKQQLEEKKRIESERLNQERFKSECISKFGENNGIIISRHQVKIGMSKDMCLTSWGTPLYYDKTTIKSGSYEIWYYILGKRLYFENNELVRIDE